LNFSLWLAKKRKVWKEWKVEKELPGNEMIFLTKLASHRQNV